MAKIVIVMATYNPDIIFFKEQVFSLIGQTFTDWTAIVSDESTDSAKEDEILQFLKVDSRFHFIKNNERSGSIYNFENGLKAINNNCELIAFCDQDDIWEPNKLERLEKLFKDLSLQVVHSDLTLIDQEGRKIADSCWESEKRDFSRKDLYSLFLRNNITGCSMIFRKEILNKALPFSDQKQETYCYHDHWVALFGLARGKILEIPEPLLRYRQHSNNVIGAAIVKRKSLYNKLLDLQFLFRKSAIAYVQRQALYNDLVSREMSLKEDLKLWTGGLIFFSIDLLSRAIYNSVMRRLSLQLILGYILVNYFSYIPKQPLLSKSQFQKSKNIGQNKQK